jgi:predicted Zn-dependent peptidase
VTRLPNGVRVGAETWVGGQPAITVLVKAGSRQEHLENSSAASFAAHGALLGTGKYSK